MIELRKELSEKVTSLLSTYRFKELNDKELEEFYSSDLWLDRSNFKYAYLAEGEPDVFVWVNKETSLPCLMLRASFNGTWCGYVGVPESHVYYKKDFAEIRSVEVHGGLTYSNFCEIKTAFFNKKMGNNYDKNKYWWLGFDCFHYRDTGLKEVSYFDESYRTQTYVESECEYLAIDIGKALFKQQALVKLTEEEKEALGL